MFCFYGTLFSEDQLSYSLLFVIFPFFWETNFGSLSLRFKRLTDILRFYFNLQKLFSCIFIIIIVFLLPKINFIMLDYFDVSFWMLVNQIIPLFVVIAILLRLIVLQVLFSPAGVGIKIPNPNLT